MPETPSQKEQRSTLNSLLSIFGRSKSAEDVPERLAHRMKRMERDLSRRLPERGFLKP